MPQNPGWTRRRGREGEKRVMRLLEGSGWRGGPQAGSGAIGTRCASQSMRGDLWARCGEMRMRIEVKNHTREPRALQQLRGGCDVLAYICRETGRMAVFIDEDMFRHLMSWSAEAMEASR